MKYCPRCIIPESRPHIEFDDAGNCNCATVECKRAVDWDERKRMFLDLVADARKRNCEYDCIIPVSGGKDSTWQVVTCLQHGFKPLCVTWRPPRRTDIGQANLDNLISLGVDHIDFSVNPDVERRFIYQSFKQHGTPAIPMHMALFAIPLNMAVRFCAPLVIWGENSAFEYGGDDQHRHGLTLSRDWLMKYGATNGTTAEDWVGEQLSSRDLRAYFWPTDEQLRAAGVKAIFLGAYFPWDPQETKRIAESHGFCAADDGPRTGSYDFADIDDAFISIHHWMKWYKFGFTRSFDNLSIEIRNGRLTRNQAIAQLQSLGDQTPYNDIDAFCQYLKITREHFFDMAERFRNTDIWTNLNGQWMIENFLVPDWSWA